MLQTQNVDISLAEGIQSKIDEKLIGEGANLYLYNARFPKINTLSKRFGYTHLPTEIYNTSPTENLSDYGAARFILSNENDLFAICQNGTFKYISGQNTWLKLNDEFKFYNVSSNVLYDSGITENGPTSHFIESEDVSFTAYDEYNGSGFNIDSQVVFKDHASNTKIKTNLGGSFNTIGAKMETLINSGLNYGVFGYGQVGGFRVGSIDENGIVTTASAPSITTLHNYNYNASCVKSDGLKACFAIGSGTSSTLNLVETNYDNSVVTTNKITLTGNCESYNLAITPICLRHFGSNYFFAYKDVSTNNLVMVAIDDSTYTISKAEVNIDTTANLVNFTFEVIDASTIKVIAEYENASHLSDPLYNYLKISTIDYTGAFSVSATSTYLGLCLGSHAVNESGTLKFIATNGTDLQKTNFLVDDSLTVYSRMDKGRSVGSIANHQLPNLSSITNGYYFPNEASIRFFSDNDTKSNGATVQQTYFTNNITYQHGSRVKIRNNIMISNGGLYELDSNGAFENGHYIFPEKIAVSLFSATLGGITAGTRAYRAVYETYDINGKVSRSAPSIAYSFVNSGTTDRNQIVVPTLKLGVKSDNRTRIVVYRTVASGTTFYRVKEFESCSINNKAVDTVSFIDDVSDAGIATNEILYTSGGELDNDPAPVCSLVAAGNSRVFLAGLENKNEIAFSKIINRSEAVHFSDFFRISVDPSNDTGDSGVTAIGFLGDVLIAFKGNDNVYYIAGDGPLNTGLDDNFTKPIKIPSDAGCTEPRSVINIPTGLMYKSNKGFYLLDRTYQTRPIGFGVERYNSFKVMSSVLLKEQNQVRFILENNYALVYDFLLDKWDVYDNYNGIDADIYQDTQVTLVSNSVIKHEDTSIYTDNGSYVSMKVITPWIKLSSLQGFQRIRRAILLGTYKTPHSITIKAYFDYDDTYFETHTITASATDIYQYMAHIGNQKSTAVKFEIFDNPSSGTGQSCEWDLLSLEAGIKKGPSKIKPSKRF